MVWLRLAIITAIAVAVTVVHDIYHLFDTSLTPTPFTLVGLALSIFLGFRNTPIPFPHTVIIHRIVAVYCMAMPFGWSTPSAR